jgi:hypothetical protein
MTRLSPERDGSATPGWDLLDRLLFDPDEKPLRRVLIVLAAMMTVVVVVLVVVGLVAKEAGPSLGIGGVLAGAGAGIQQIIWRRRNRRGTPGNEDQAAEKPGNEDQTAEN